MGISDSRERVTSISQSYSGKKEERKPTMVSKPEYVPSVMIFFKEQTKHTGNRNVDLFFLNLFLFNIVLSSHTFIKNISSIWKYFDNFYF